ncbi:hypothetical protein BD289DRAFT_458542 [Coniella lustricola]|uniref:NAD(P)-binding protein n=1 Tax=Coniella lustricola TaxID=2025994 RepID=A0A2T3AIV7_9PEZI|nr:hypothetical protein BD289DRAFT_458542 [Coniella lustricola]
MAFAIVKVNTKPYQLPADALWFSTGCSSGIGRAIAELVASKPAHRLVATARNSFSLSYLPDNDADGRILKLALDVTSPTSVKKAFRAAAEHFQAPTDGGGGGGGGGGRGRFHIDVLVNNAGYELAGDTESATEEGMHLQMETNFFGVVRVTLQAMQHHHDHHDHDHDHHRGGIIFNMSSLAGVAAFPGYSFYHASKFAVEGWSESFARELDPAWNLHMCIVEPGGVKTEFERRSKKYTAAGKGGVEAGAVALAVYKVASGGGSGAEEKEQVKCVPLWLPLTSTAVQLIRAKMQASLENLEAVSNVSAI